MKLIFSILVFLFFTSASFGQTESFISSNVLSNTFLIHTDTLAGTCFAMKFNDEEYIITAKHLFRRSLSNQDSTTVGILVKEKLTEFKAKYLISTDNTVDIAVLKINAKLSKIPPYPRVEKTVLGKELYFLGYPSFNKMQFKTLDKNIEILPLVKKAIFSGGYLINNYTLFFLDGHNNPGFSGGPVIAHDYSINKNGIIGVISGYYSEEKKLQNKNKEYLEEYILENSGIIKCFPINLAEEIIMKAN